MSTKMGEAGINGFRLLERKPRNLSNRPKISYVNFRDTKTSNPPDVSIAAETARCQIHLSLYVFNSLIAENNPQKDPVAIKHAPIINKIYIKTPPTW